ncbi:hypothetical protein EJB05_14506, partial [Eragrostis curvula]
MTIHSYPRDRWLISQLKLNSPVVQKWVLAKLIFSIRVIRKSIALMSSCIFANNYKYTCIDASVFSQSLSVRSGSSLACTTPLSAEPKAALPAGVVETVTAASRKLPSQPKLSSSSPTKKGIGASRCCSGCAADACAWMPMG